MSQVKAVYHVGVFGLRSTEVHEAYLIPPCHCGVAYGDFAPLK